MSNAEKAVGKPTLTLDIDISGIPEIDGVRNIGDLVADIEAVLARYGITNE